MKALSFGEIIIDIENGKKTVGGAPLNFAIHVGRMGMESYIYSALGNDENGEMAKAAILSEGIMTNHLFHSSKETATCILKDGGYRISENSSFDFIPYSPTASDFDLLYVGTLALRSEETRRTFELLYKNGKFNEVYFDINIRQSFYSEELIESLLKKATIYKASREDVYALYGKDTDLREYCQTISSKYSNINIIIITLDKDGAMLYDARTERFIFSPPHPCKFKSSVGAGDSFSAAFVSCYLKGAEIEKCLDAGCMLGAYVASMDGAVPIYSERLTKLLKEIYDVY